MKSVRRIQDQIDRASKRRQDAWRAGNQPELAAKLTQDLERLYGELRQAESRTRNGAREDIVRSARVERELEKLMAD